MESHDFAWAAGFFDGEGWANRSGRGVQSRINQAGLDGVPEVLTKFQRIVGVGRIKGPVVAEGRQPLYYWEATSRPDLTRVAELIASWLCQVKRAQFERTLGGTLPPLVWPGSMSEELAWAGGFFDGEGSTYLEKHRSHRGYFAPRLHVTQSGWGGVAPELLRFKSAIGDIGRISGASKNKRDHKPYRRWRAYAENEVQLGIHLLLPFIGQVKRQQALAVMLLIHSQARLPRGNPAFGVAGARYCLRGHDKWNARVRPFKGRGKNEQDPLNHLRQCLACVREDAKVRRKKERRP
ncbi:MAG: hypothetical protein AABM40_14220 [Chloroflexota bacterium]